jgi:predicted metal-dependent phosphoesterase TrpH
MLKFARNKVIGVTRKDADTLSIHGVLDDDIYGLEIDLCVGIKDLQFLSIAGKWNRWTTPECPGAIPFLQEAKGFYIDEEIGNKINKTVGRKGCRHFANLLIECCYAATQAAKVARWEDAKAASRDLTFERFLAQEAEGGSTVGERIPLQDQVSASSSPPQRVEVIRGEQRDEGPSHGRPESSTGGFVIDLHVHTSPASPCSCAAEDLVIEEAKRIGLNGICFTDHNHVWSPARVQDLSQKHGFLVLRGNEITTDQGDVLVFGLEKDIKGIIKLQDLRKEVLGVGGFLIVAHPFRGFLTFSADQIGLTHERAAQRPLFQWVDAVEVMNGKVTEKENRFAAKVAESLGLPVTGGSDAHELAEVGVYATRFSANIQTEAELIQALESKEYVPVAFRSEKDGQARGNGLAEVNVR